MTVPKSFKAATQRVSDFVMELFPKLRQQMSLHEEALAIHLRGNGALLNALKGLIESRIEGRASLPEPSDPLVCKSMLARDRELRWFLSRLEYLYSAPAPGDDGEQPA